LQAAIAGHAHTVAYVEGNINGSNYLAHRSAAEKHHTVRYSTVGIELPYQPKCKYSILW